MVDSMTDAERKAHNASYAVLALLSDEDLRAAWREHWRQFNQWSWPGEWYDRHCEFFAEAAHRGIFLSGT